MSGLGTYRTLDSGGVQFTLGGKKNRVIAFEISAEEIENFALKCKERMPEFAHKAAGRAASGCRAQFRKVMKSGGGEYGVPKFKEYDPFTVLIRDGNPGRIGGVLAEPWAIAMWKRDKVQYIGWPDAVKGKHGGYKTKSSSLKDLATKFQEGAGGFDAEKWFTDTDYRRMWHRRGIREIPRAYVHNPRQALSFYAQNIDRNLDDFRKGVMKKMIATEIAKAAQSAGKGRWR